MTKDRPVEYESEENSGRATADRANTTGREFCPCRATCHERERCLCFGFYCFCESPNPDKGKLVPVKVTWSN